MVTWVGFEPTDQQLRLMQLVFAHFEANGDWPFLQFARLQAAKVGIANIDECLRLLPSSYLYPRVQPLNAGDEVRLTVPALAKLDAARPELGLFLASWGCLAPDSRHSSRLLARYGSSR
jgi:hypothetical protein